MPRSFYQYNEDDIRRLLIEALPEPRFVIFDHILFNDEAILLDSICRAIEFVVEGRIAVLPINIDNNHWVGAIIRQNEGRMQLIYNDPAGIALEVRPNAGLLIHQLRAIDPDVEIIDLGVRQQDTPYDCGPFVVNNLVLLAQQRAEANADEMRALLEVDINSLRTTHAATLLDHIADAATLLDHIAVDFPESDPLITENSHQDIVTSNQGLPAGNAGALCCYIIVAAAIMGAVAGMVSMMTDHSEV